jgi:hypothetical protein
MRHSATSHDALFARTYQPYRFSEIIIFFSHNKSVSASAVFPASQIGPGEELTVRGNADSILNLCLDVLNAI